MVLGSTDANRVLLVAEHLVMEEEADLNLFYITDADHQPWTVAGALQSPLETEARRSHHGNICRHINTVDTSNGIEGTEIGNGSQVLIAGAANQLDPPPLRQSVITRKAGTAGCQ